jgi:hypothetical protein
MVFLRFYRFTFVNLRHDTIYLTAYFGELLVCLPKPHGEDFRELQDNLDSEIGLLFDQLEEIGPEETDQRAICFANCGGGSRGFIQKGEFAKEVAVGKYCQLFIFTLALGNPNCHFPFPDDIHPKPGITLIKDRLACLVLAFMDDRRNTPQFTRGEISKSGHFAQNRFCASFLNTLPGEDVSPEGTPV